MALAKASQQPHYRNYPARQKARSLWPRLASQGRCWLRLKAPVQSLAVPEAHLPRLRKLPPPVKPKVKVNYIYLSPSLQQLQ
ncbi:hypothetical protein D3C75_1135610 [compost metagenome]